jgi:hypothetical protein
MLTAPRSPSGRRRQVAAKSYVNILLINAIVLAAILLLSVRYLLPLLVDWSGNEIVGHGFALGLTMLISLPFYGA